MVIHSSFEDFLLFLYVHISQSDNTYDPKELGLIKEKMRDIYPAETDFEKKLYGTLRAYNTFDKSKLRELIEDTFKHFHTNKLDKKEKIIADLFDIINADGRVEASETKAIDTLKNTINSSL